MRQTKRQTLGGYNIGLADQSWMEEFKMKFPPSSMKLSAQQTQRAATAKLYEEFQGMHPELLTVT